MTEPSIQFSSPARCSEPNKSDEQLACRAQKGCRPSFEELVRRFQVRLLRFLQRQVRSAVDAEDLLQDTFVRAYQRLNQYDGGKAFGTWLFTIAHRLAVSHHRRQLVAGRATKGFIDRMQLTEQSDPVNRMAEEEDRQAFWNVAADVLNEEQLSAIWLFYVEEMPAPQIAEIMGKSWVSVKTLLFRARRKLMPQLLESTSNGIQVSRLNRASPACAAG